MFVVIFTKFNDDYKCCDGWSSIWKVELFHERSEAEKFIRNSIISYLEKYYGIEVPTKLTESEFYSFVEDKLEGEFVPTTLGWEIMEKEPITPRPQSDAAWDVSDKIRKNF